MFCGASRTTGPDGQIALSLGFVKSETPLSASCLGVTVLDTTSGRLGWDTTVAYEGGVLQGDVAGMPLEIVKDTVVVGWDFNVFGLALADGSQRWHSRLQSEPGLRYPNCPLVDLVPGAAESVTVLAHCILRNGRTYYSLAEISAVGRTVRAHDLTDAEAGAPIGTAQLISGAPPVLSLTSRDTNDDRTFLLGFTPEWVPGLHRADRMTSPDALATVAVGFANGIPGAYSPDNRALVDGGVLYAVTAPNQQTANRLVALDLASGRELWSLRTDGQVAMQVLETSRNRVRVLRSAVDEQNDHTQSVVEVDRVTGAVLDVVSDTPQNSSGGPAHSAFYSYTWADDRAYAVHVANYDDSAYRFVFTVG